MELILTQLFSRRSISNIYVCADSTLPYGDIFFLLDIARRSGAQDITLFDKMAGTSCEAILCLNCPDGGAGGS
jgi:hypothetical protein